MKTRSNKVAYPPPAAPNPIHHPDSKPVIETAGFIKTSSDDDNNSSSSDSFKFFFHEFSPGSTIKAKRSDANDPDNNTATDSNDNISGDSNNDGKNNYRFFLHCIML